MTLPYAFLHLQTVKGDFKFHANCKATHSEGDYSRLGFIVNPDTEITVTKEKKEYRSQPHINYSIHFKDINTNEEMRVKVHYLPGYGSGRGSVRCCSSWSLGRSMKYNDKCIVVFDNDSIELNFYQTEWPRPASLEKREKIDAFNRFLKNDKEILKSLKLLRLDATRI